MTPEGLHNLWLTMIRQAFHNGIAMLGANFKYLSVTIVLMILSALAGFLAASLKPQSTPAVNLKAQAPASNPLFISQTANVQAKITDVSGNKIKVMDDKNQSGEFTLNDKFIVYVPGSDSKVASASSEPKSIIKNKLSYIVLQLINGDYQVTSISYPPEPSPLPSTSAAR